MQGLKKISKIHKYFSLNVLFTAFLVAFLGGIFITNLIEHFSLSAIILLTLIFFGLYFLYFFGKKYVLLFVFLIVGFFVGTSVSAIDQARLTAHQAMIERHMGLYQEYKGSVHSVYKKSDYYDEYIVKLQEIEDTGVSSDLRHLLRVPKNFSLEPGQEIVYSGKMYPFEDFNGFAYEKFMLAQNLYFSTSTQNIETLSYHRDWRYHFFLQREKLLARIDSIFPREEAIFLGGILLGARENIPRELEEDFNTSGLTHFIAVSGFNITLCIIFVSFLFGFFPLWIRIFFVILTIVSFSLFVGLVAPVVRASIMGILGYIFLQSGTSQKNMTLLAFTASLMALYSPLGLSYDVSLHLSFLAVMGIIYTQEFFKKLFAFVPDFFAIREALVLTLSALSFALPIMIFQFGQISLLSPFANIAVTWTIPLAMLGGALTLICDMFSQTLGQILGFVTWIFLHYDMLMVRLFGNAQWAVLRFDFGLYKNYFQIFYFIVLIYIVSLFHLKKFQKI